MPDTLDQLAAMYGGGRALKVVWACGGDGAVVVRELVRRLPGTHTVVERARKPRSLEDEVLFGGAHLGLAIDGGRLGVVDGEGRTLAPDQTLAIVAADLLRRQPGAAVVGEVLCSQVLFDEVARLGGSPLMAAADPDSIRCRMAETGAPVGGDADGRIHLGDGGAGPPPLPAAMRVLSMVAGWERQTLTQRRDRLPHRVATPVTWLDCGQPEAVIARIQARLEAEGVSALACGGVRVSAGDGWWAVRPSLAEPGLAIRAEAATSEGLRRLRGRLDEALAAAGAA